MLNNVITYLWLLRSLVILIPFSGLFTNVHGQVTIAKYERGGNRVELIYLNSTKIEADRIQRREDSIHCRSCNRQSFVIGKSELEKLSLYIKVNGSSSTIFPGKLNDDFYVVSIDEGVINFKFNKNDGESFLKRLAKWINQKKLYNSRRLQVSNAIRKTFLLD